MQIGFTKTEILGMLDQHLVNLTEELEEQVNKVKDSKENTEIGLATLITSSMLSLLEAVSAVIELNNQKVYEDLKDNGLLKEDASA